MATAQQSQMGPFNLDFNAMKATFDTWLKTQHPGVEVALVGLQSGVQGGLIGYMFGSLGGMAEAAGGVTPGAPNPFAALQAGGPWGQAKNLAVLTGVNATLTLALKKLRNGKDDVWGDMGASFGSGAAFSLVSGAPNPFQAAFTTGLVFAGFNGMFSQVRRSFFTPEPGYEDTAYDQGKYILTMLGLKKYENNLKKCLLTDDTIMLWNENALQEAQVPAGPRLKILHHLDAFKHPASNVLKPALPINQRPMSYPMPPGAQRPMMIAPGGAVAGGPR